MEILPCKVGAIQFHLHLKVTFFTKRDKCTEICIYMMSLDRTLFISSTVFAVAYISKGIVEVTASFTSPTTFWNNCWTWFVWTLQQNMK